MTTLDILRGIEARLKTKWPEPETAYYQDLAPKGFSRPSFLVECGPVTQTELGGYTTSFELKARIVGFLPVDAYHHSHIPDLCQVRDEVMALFGCGYFPVGSRNPHVDSIDGDYGYDYAEVNLSISFTERWDGADESKYPLLQSVCIKIKDKEE